MTRGLSSDARVNLLGAASMEKSDNVAEEAPAFAHDVKFQSGGAANELQEEAVSADEQSELPGFTDIQQPRRNFNETAFFFPQLRTNDKGETQLAFTVPESNTRWRFRYWLTIKS